jgi:hypothetical protein
LHRKSLNFINGYFELKTSLMSDIDTFISKKLVKKYKLNDKDESKNINAKRNIIPT